MRDSTGYIMGLVLAILVYAFWGVVWKWLALAVFMVVIFPGVTIPLFLWLKVPCSYGKLPPRK